MTRDTPVGLPDVTVIVIVFNDAKRLPVAVESVRRQTLRNLEVIIVDDASTDGTGDVAESLAAADPRVSVVHLEENSGGCSRPRNAGLERARAPYVMFLDSDDEYERHACKNLLYAAERNDADIVAGKCVRLHLSTGKTTPWYERLYDEPAVYHGINDNPEQLWDSLANNKLYRRGFLDDNELRFVEGLHYEDLLFMTEAYSVAERIVVIRSLVYVWKVDAEAERQSITSRTHEVSNFRDRIEVHRRIKQYLRAHNHMEVEAAVDRKFIKHDLRLYLDQFPDQPMEYQRDVMALATEHLAHIDPAAYDDVPSIQRARAYLVQRGDLEETVKTTRFITEGRRLTMDLVRRGDRIYATDKYLDDPVAQTMLDVSDLPGLQGPFSHLRFENAVTRVTAQRSRLVIEGQLHDPLMLIADTGLRATLRFRSRAGGTEREVPIDDVQRDGPTIRWSAAVDVRGDLPVTSAKDRIWHIAFKIESAKGINTAALVATNVEHIRSSLGRPLGGIADTLRTGSTKHGNLRLELTAEGRALILRQRLAGRLERWGPYRTAKTVPALVTGPALKTAVYRSVFLRLPVRRRQIVFESHMATQYSDSPRAIYETLLRSGLPHHAVWSYAGDTTGFPTTARLVERGSWGYYYALARAEFWIDNQGLGRQFDKPSGTTYIQTWHGTALKKMGFDTELRHRTLERQREFEETVNRWDYLTVQNEFSVNTFVPAFRYRGEILRIGLPRNDVLVTGGDPAQIEAVRRRLDIPPDRKVILYAPTFRDVRRRRRKPFEMQLNLTGMQEALEDEFVLLVRTHYLDDYRLPSKSGTFARDVSKHHDAVDLLLIADVLITDFSSVMFDYANLRRPMIFFTYDYSDYVGTQRGLYAELSEIAPGPLVEDPDEVTALLSDLTWPSRYAERYDAFVRQFCQYDVGKASETVVERIIAGRS